MEKIERRDEKLPRPLVTLDGVCRTRAEFAEYIAIHFSVEYECRKKCDYYIPDDYIEMCADIISRLMQDNDFISGFILRSDSERTDWFHIVIENNIKSRLLESLSSQMCKAGGQEMMLFEWLYKNMNEELWNEKGKYMLQIFLLDFFVQFLSSCENPRQKKMVEKHHKKAVASLMEDEKRGRMMFRVFSKMNSKLVFQFISCLSKKIGESKNFHSQHFLDWFDEYLKSF